MSYKITVDDDFLAHHGVQGMKWGVHNDETKRKYGELPTGGGGGGGGDDEEEDDRPEALLKAGKIDAKTAALMRAQMDKVIEKSENGLLNAPGAYEKQMNLIYANAGVPQPYPEYKIATSSSSKPNLSDYSPYTEKGQKLRQKTAEEWASEISEGARGIINQHLRDIERGKIDREEARIIGIVNAAAGMASGTGEGLINNPKAEEMGVKYGQRTTKIRRV